MAVAHSTLIVPLPSRIPIPSTYDDELQLPEVPAIPIGLASALLGRTQRVTSTSDHGSNWFLFSELRYADFGQYRYTGLDG